MLVAPHAGAWIETRQSHSRAAAQKVAPHAGAWIETYNPLIYYFHLASPPMRGRGLKPIVTSATELPIRVAPHAGAWIETDSRLSTPPDLMSPPMRGRGLKQQTPGSGVLGSRRPPCGGVD